MKMSYFPPQIEVLALNPVGSILSGSNPDSLSVNFSDDYEDEGNAQ